MTLFGLIFWGVFAMCLISAFYIQRKYKSGTPEKSLNQEMNEASTRLDNARNDRPRL
ncbi:hypothetical protein [Bacillus sp. 165]|uniref:hypothetical protein n=1 Tax=Bacillus sp. 165 TaxID=1529117 RepID=UPI001AD9DFE1|nr:hypothetical protein [Bacillus sp. 165]MBO9131466.1 hypothetical protein [Bacillus sp. 165]